MDASRRTSTLRRVALVAPLALLLIPAGQADAKANKAKKPPVITSVSPMEATVGDKLTIRGHNFRKGKGTNGIGFKRDGAPVVFVRSDLSTEKLMTVVLPEKLETVLYGGTPARFHLRILTNRFGKAFTPDKLSPTIAPRPEVAGNGPTGPTGPDGGTPTAPTTPAFNPAGPEGDCDGDKVLNKNEVGGLGADGDIDNDLLTNDLEDNKRTGIGTDLCKADSDDDGVIDSYEYKSAVDLNDDEYQSPQTVLPYPGQRPYPNPLFKDSDRDYDRDVLTLAEEYDLWAADRDKNLTPAEFASKDYHLSYSDGLQYSKYDRAGNGRRVPKLEAAGYDKQVGTEPGKLGFLPWVQANGYAGPAPDYPGVVLQTPDYPFSRSNPLANYDIRDVNRDGQVTTGCAGEELYYDYDCDGFLSDDERDEDADGLTNYDEAHGRMTQGYWKSCYQDEGVFQIPYAGTDLVQADSDGDGVRDGADDQDHDDVPNMMELSRMDASRVLVDTPANGTTGLARAAGSGFDETKGGECVPLDNLEPENPRHPFDYGKVQPFDPCDPALWSRTCDRHPSFGDKADPIWWSLQ